MELIAVDENMVCLDCNSNGNGCGNCSRSKKSQEGIVRFVILTDEIRKKCDEGTSPELISDLKELIGK